MMKKIKKSKNKLIKCPICESPKADIILDLKCGNLDDSTLYQHMRINVCTRCGHTYNRLSSQEIDGLLKYYSKERAPLNQDSRQFVIKRRRRIYNFLSPYLQKDFRVFDIGCSDVAFLGYLKKQRLERPYGLNLIVADQVVEHLVDPRKFFREAKRVLIKNGLLCVSVPDASRYKEAYFFDFFWFLIREHIQHFDLEHLKLPAVLEGFEYVIHTRYKTAITSEKMMLPVLNVVFRLTDKRIRSNTAKDPFDLKRQIKSYVASESKRLDKKRKIISRLVKSQKPVYVWGIGREFLYLYESAGLKDCNLVGLIDSNLYKRNTFLVGGRKITDGSILKKAAPDSALIISAVAHTQSVEKELKNMKYHGQIIKYI